jgi:hypothetical protein
VLNLIQFNFLFDTPEGEQFLLGDFVDSSEFVKQAKRLVKQEKSQRKESENSRKC